MRIRVLPIQSTSGEVLDQLRTVGPTLDESRILRIDLAWEMFYGRGFTWENRALFLRLPNGKPRDTSRLFLRWMRSVCSQLINGIARTLHQEQPPMLVLLPPCAPEAEELMIRQLSFYTETVEKASTWDGATDPFQVESKDVWIAPIVPADANTDLLRHQRRINETEEVILYQTALGIENVYMQKYTLQPGAIYSRLHTHSDVDEMYLVVQGNCTFTFGTREQAVSQGDLVTKPKGTGLATQIYNHSNEPVTILDMEVWTDTEGTDICIYQDHAEVVLRGRGFKHQVPLDAIEVNDDLSIHYDEGYRRLRDGSFVPKALRGVPTRKKR